IIQVVILLADTGNIVLGEELGTKQGKLIKFDLTETQKALVKGEEVRLSGYFTLKTTTTKPRIVRPILQFQQVPIDLLGGKLTHLFSQQIIIGNRIPDNIQDYSLLHFLSTA
ncbi:11190_t:CDS:1, partial [Ambispora gerdemannii]